MGSSEQWGVVNSGETPQHRRSSLRAPEQNRPSTRLVFNTEPPPHPCIIIHKLPPCSHRPIVGQMTAQIGHYNLLRCRRICLSSSVPPEQD